MKRTRAQKGFTLIELIISMAIVILAVALAGAGFAAQNQALQASDMRRQGNASTRDAMLTLEQTLRMTGWGIDPRWAIDRKTTTNLPSVITIDLRNTDSATTPDVLSVLARNPLYQWVDAGGVGCAVGTVGGCFTGNAWAIVPGFFNYGARTIRINMSAGQVIEKGRVILVQCIGGTNPVLLTVSATKSHSGATGPEDVLYDNVDTYPYNAIGSLQTAPASSCHNLPGSSLYLVDRSRFFIQNDTQTPPNPWLMLDPGIDLDGNNTVGNAGDFIPIAKNIEDLQVAFVMSRAPGGTPLDSNANWVVGDELDTVEQLDVQSANTDLPQYTTANNDGSRLTRSPANIRAVRVTLVTRSVRGDRTREVFAGDVVVRGENARNPTNALSGGKFLRFPATTEIYLRNMDSQRPFTF